MISQDFTIIEESKYTVRIIFMHQFSYTVPNDDVCIGRTIMTFLKMHKEQNL